MADNCAFPFSDQPHGTRLELPKPAFPGRRPLLRGREASGYCDTTRVLSLDEHQHAQFQLSFHFDGASGSIVRRRKSSEWHEQPLNGPQVYCVDPEVLHFARWESSAPLVEAYFEPAFFARVAAKDVTAVIGRESHPSASRDAVLWLYAATLRQLSLEQQEPPRSLFEPILLAMGQRFFAKHGCLAFYPVNGGRLSPERLQLVRDYIEKNLATPIRVAELAKLVSLSAAHFTEVFGNTVGLSPMEYVRERRFIKAHEMAFSCEYRFGEIADACGFSDGSHLNREFTKFFGYRARLLRYRWTAANDSENP